MNKDLAQQVTQLPDVTESKHKAVDRVTAANLKTSLLNRYHDDPVKELIREEETIELMEDAVYQFRKYLRLKLKRYEQLLDENCNKGN